MSPPFFSIVIPVYNRVSLLCERISLILKQTYSDFEIVVIDDGSKEEIAPVLRKQFGHENKIVCLRQENKERGAARNNGFKAAKGKYVIFFDSDDLMHANHLEVLAKGISENNEPYFIATQFDFVDDNGRHFSSDIQSLAGGFHDYNIFLSGNPLACNVCVRKDNPELILFEEDRSYAIKEDWMFLIANTKQHPLYLIPEVTISMFDHPERSMRSNNSVIIERTHKAVTWIENRLSLSNSEKQALRAHENYFCGIHWYLESNRVNACKSALKAIRYGGLQFKYIALLLKSLAGRNLISRIK